jgi:hypothetical protein
MEKFIEELDSGDFFELENNRFILTSDYKKSGDRLAINTLNGNSRWFKSDCHVFVLDLYTMDSENNFMPIKEAKSDVPSQAKNLF